jgi:hypothetical protein
VVRALLAACLVAAAGCQQIYGLDEGEPYPDGAGGEGGAAPSGPWGCLGRVGEPAGAEMRYRYFFRRSNGVATNEFTTELCAAADSGCSQPLDSPAVNANGELFLELDATFEGFLDLSGAAFPPYLVELGPATNHPPADRLVPMYAAWEIDLFFAVTGKTKILSRGLVGIAASDCDGAPLSGVYFQLDSDHTDEQTSVSYSGTAGTDGTPPTATNETGTAAFVNVLGGSRVLVRSFRDSDDAPLGAAEVHVRAGTVTVLHLGPTE